MTAQDYPITFPYGATDGTYYGPLAAGKPTYVGPYHRGDDRAMPMETPVVVNGVTIGYSGMTGAASGPHLHVGRFISGNDTNPGGQGLSLSDASVTDVGYDATNGKYVGLRDASGVRWVYLHLDNILVNVGETLPANQTTSNEGGADMGASVNFIKMAFEGVLNREADTGALAHYQQTQYNDPEFILRDLLNSTERATIRSNLDAQASQAAQVPILEQQIGELNNKLATVTEPVVVQSPESSADVAPLITKCDELITKLDTIFK